VTVFEAGLAELRSDAPVKRRAALAMAMTVEERLAEAVALCRAAAELLATMPADRERRVRAHRESLPPDAEATVRRWLVGP
jgi:hypothetical protein